MTKRSTGFVRGAMLGAASGILSQSGMVAVLKHTPESELPLMLGSRWVQRSMAVSALGEVLSNAFVSSLPPRTDRAPLTGRIVLGALAGGLATRSSVSSGLIGTMTGGVVAPIAAWVSTTSRAKLSRRFPDILIATGETVIAFGLARLATN